MEYCVIVHKEGRDIVYSSILIFPMNKRSDSLILKCQADTLSGDRYFYSFANIDKESSKKRSKSHHISTHKKMFVHKEDTNNLGHNDF